MNITATDAKQRFGDFVLAAMSGKRVTITRHGKPLLVAVTAERMEQLEHIEEQAQKFIFREGGGEEYPPRPE